MSTPRYEWWGHVKSVIRRYPHLCQKAADLHSVRITPSYEGLPGGGSRSDKTANAALRQLPDLERIELEAVQAAIHTTEAMPDGRRRMELLWQAGADVLLIETQPSLAEARVGRSQRLERIQAEQPQLWARYQQLQELAERNTRHLRRTYVKLSSSRYAGSLRDLKLDAGDIRRRAEQRRQARKAATFTQRFSYRFTTSGLPCTAG